MINFVGIVIRYLLLLVESLYCWVLLQVWRIIYSLRPISKGYILNLFVRLHTVFSLTTVVISFFS
jgi:hypothetical protein